MRRDWLARAARYTTNLWLCEMPSDSMPDVAQEGETLLCRAMPCRRWRTVAFTVFLLDRRPIVRRLQITPKGLVLKASDPTLDPITFRSDALEGMFEGLVPVGRVLGSIALKPA